MVPIEITYRGDLRCEAQHGPSGMLLQTDAPVDNQGKGQAFSPTDLVATALGTCVLTIMGIMARRLELDLGRATVRVQKEMAAQPLRRIGRLVVDIHVPRPIPPEMQQRLESGVKTCPVHQSLHPDVKVEMVFHWA